MRAVSVAFAAIAVFALVASCSRRPADDRRNGTGGELHGAKTPANRTVDLTPGVRYRAIPAEDSITGGSPVWLVEADLGTAGLAVRVVASGLRERESPRYGDCYTAALWCSVTGGMAAVNGGYFGEGDEKRKEIVGLLVQDGKVQSSGSQRTGSRGPYVRSVFGIGTDSLPEIRWAAGRRGNEANLAWFADPEQPQPSGMWTVREAVGCGPTLVVDGKVRVTDREERLVSPGRLPRTFLGYSVRSGKPDRLVMAVTPAMEYADAAAFMAEYFRREHHVMCKRAMCLDGGASSQLACVADGSVIRPMPEFVTMPTAIVIRARTKQSADGS